jgi:uncharacterized membrane protein (UPF0127 family)
MRFKALRRHLAAVFAVLFVACKAASSSPVVDLTVSSESGKRLEQFTVELASTNEERSKGLMFRRELGAREGMLFLFPEERKLSFWMKNTLIPLDMVFISKDWRVVGVVEYATPLSEEPRGVGQNSQYVLEVAGGTAKRLGMAAGSIVTVAGQLPRPQ